MGGSIWHDMLSVITHPLRRLESLRRTVQLAMHVLQQYSTACIGLCAIHICQVAMLCLSVHFNTCPKINEFSRDSM